MSKDLRLDIAMRTRKMRSQFNDRGYPEILDELCECGHYLSCHADLLDLGHGQCELCDCNHFIWSGFIVKQVVVKDNPPETPVPKVCPLFATVQRTSLYSDALDIDCERENCAWWKHEQCAMVDLCAAVDVMCSVHEDIERHLHCIAEHTGDR